MGICEFLQTAVQALKIPLSCGKVWEKPLYNSIIAHFFSNENISGNILTVPAFFFHALPSFHFL
jgi:hypothetical protein